MRGQGFTARGFSYATTRRPLRDGAAGLLDFCQQSEAETTHLLGHSLGGLLILLMLQDHEWRRPGRVLFLGSPLNGSAVARRALSWPGGEHLFGRAKTLLTSGALHWPDQRETGLIAGTRGLGLGRVTGGLEVPNDGTVSVAETLHPGLSAHQELPVTHTGMLYSAQVAEAAAGFLRSGHF